jgi:methylmalonyl-CoA mutase N-terminal domain/subunit
MEESGTCDTIDPLGGSYAIEALTDALDEKAERLIADVDKMGGMIRAIEEGFPQREIERAAYDYQRSLERGDQKIVGVNAYTEEEAAGTPVFRVNPDLERSQIAALQARRKERDGAAVEALLGKLEAASRGRENLVPIVLDAVKARASVGEICSALAKTFHRYREQRSL